MGGIIGLVVSLLFFTLLIKLGHNQVCRTVCTSESTQNINAMLQSFRMGPGEDNDVTPQILGGALGSVFGNNVHVETNHVEVSSPSQHQFAFGANATRYSQRIQHVIPSQSLFGTQQNVPLDVQKGADVPGECEIFKSGIDAKGVQEILHLHNKLRNKVAEGKQAGLPSASKIMQLKWNEDMAKLAQEHSNNCQFKHNEVHIDKYRNSLGQNVAISFSPVKDLKPNFKKPVSDWYAEVKQFSAQDINPYVASASTGHFTQLVWADTTEVGCGYTIFYVKEKANYYKLTVCNYGVAGNVDTYPVYKVGQTCSKCSNCSSKYSGLCVS